MLPRRCADIWYLRGWLVFFAFVLDTLTRMIVG